MSTARSSSPSPAASPSLCPAPGTRDALLLGDLSGSPCGPRPRPAPPPALPGTAGPRAGAWCPGTRAVPRVQPSLSLLVLHCTSGALDARPGLLLPRPLVTALLSSPSGPRVGRPSWEPPSCRWEGRQRRPGGGDQWVWPRASRSRCPSLPGDASGAAVGPRARPYQRAQTFPAGEGKAGEAPISRGQGVGEEAGRATGLGPCRGCW